MAATPRIDGDIVISNKGFPVKLDPKTRRLVYRMAKPRVISQDYNQAGGLSIVDSGPLKRKWVFTVTCYNNLKKPNGVTYGLSSNELYNELWDLYDTTVSQTFNDRRLAKLAVAISSVGVIASFTLTTASVKFLDPTGKVKIDDEIFAYSAKDDTTGVVTVSGRAQDGTVAATHAITSPVMPHYAVRMMRFEEVSPLQSFHGVTSDSDETEVEVELQEI